MAYCLVVGEHIAAGRGGFDSPLCLLMLVRLEQYIIAALLQDIESKFGVTHAWANDYFDVCAYFVLRFQEPGANLRQAKRCRSPPPAPVDESRTSAGLRCNTPAALQYRNIEVRQTVVGVRSLAMTSMAVIFGGILLPRGRDRPSPP